MLYAILFFAVLHAVLSGYHLTNALSITPGEPARTGNFIFAALAFSTAIILTFTAIVLLWNY